MSTAVTIGLLLTWNTQLAEQQRTWPETDFESVLGWGHFCSPSELANREV